MTTITKKEKREILNTINTHRLIKDRVSELEERGYLVKERRMGSGGVGQIIVVKNEIRMQIGYGHGIYNYAMCVILERAYKIG